jgi:hypothetical protein
MCEKKLQCSSHLLVPLDALDLDLLESLVLRSELSLPEKISAYIPIKEYQDNSLALV